ncbi:sigma-70 family RNA polymerase sigma factor [Streptomyces sp. TRM75561]|uniref:sigma-70 family RNA polymerase sigma factor n=1 Tax=Streptomyces sp. TRM75561 TaxID=2975269 RepID=UPI002449E9B5|nr:sigma-70 family RNA polymerase sigma factor [Streptomyces sp. TRM75561]MDH3039217.1 sigma-70 family RNA polymerase sigma factor [Streptomyces sp. TRM75561]
MPNLFTFVSRLLGGDTHHAEDIVQETLLRCWLKYGTADRAMLRPWLFTVARNLVMDAHRKNKNRPAEIDIDQKNLADLAETGSDDVVLTSMTVKGAVRSLSPTHREVLYRTYFLQKTDEEVALDLDIPKGTVKSRRFYGLRALRLVLEEHNLGPTAPLASEGVGAKV